MGKIDVIETVSESFELIRKNYRLVALPLVVLLILSSVESFGSGSLRGDASDLFSQPKSESAKTSASLVALPESLSNLDSSLLALGGIIIALIVIFVILAIVVAIVKQATWFYVFEQFYAILNGKKITEGWQERFRRHSIRALIFSLFWFLLTLLVFLWPIMAFWNVLSAGPLGMEALWSLLVPVLLAVAVLLFLQFFIGPLWVYYALDRLSIWEAASKSFSLVSGNIFSFLLLGLIFFALGIAAGVISLALCCFSYIISPFITVFFALLYGVSLMKMKLASEKK